MVVSFLLVNGHAVVVVLTDNWFLAVPVGLAFDHELADCGGEPVDCGLGQDRVGHDG